MKKTYKDLLIESSMPGPDRYRPTYTLDYDLFQECNLLNEGVMDIISMPAEKAKDLLRTISNNLTTNKPIPKVSGSEKTNNIKIDELKRGLSKKIPDFEKNMNTALIEVVKQFNDYSKSEGVTIDINSDGSIKTVFDKTKEKISGGANAFKDFLKKAKGWSLKSWLVLLAIFLVVAWEITKVTNPNFKKWLKKIWKKINKNILIKIVTATGVIFIAGLLHYIIKLTIIEVLAISAAGAMSLPLAVFYVFLLIIFYKLYFYGKELFNFTIIGK